jgi:Gamma-glutamyl cyclotransferase, AIG2-like
LPHMFLNGTAMAGGAMHHLVGGAPLVAATRTAARYRFHAVEDAYPGLEDVGPGAGGQVAGEVYDLTWEQLRDVLLPAEPDGLELGIIELEDGSPSLAMVIRRGYAGPTTSTDITALGGWRAYREGRG